MDAGTEGLPLASGMETTARVQGSGYPRPCEGGEGQGVDGV